MGRAQAEALRQLLIDVLYADADAAAAHLALRQQLTLDVQGQIDGDGEGHAHVAAGAAVYLRIDADDLTVDIEQRAAGVARIDGRIGLNERHIVFIEGTRRRAHHAGGDAVLEAERRTDGHHPLTGDRKSVV